VWETSLLFSSIGINLAGLEKFAIGPCSNYTAQKKGNLSAWNIHLIEGL
jgi:hypothetical protein